MRGGKQAAGTELCRQRLDGGVMTRTTPFGIALSLVCALLFMAGLFVGGIGCYTYVHRNEPVLDMRSEGRQPKHGGRICQSD